MACISGSNGAGKSSLLDAFTWALFGEARRRDDTLINQRTQKENKPAEVILDFEYENDRYRVQRSKQKDKTATLDFFIHTDDGSWKPLTEATLRATEERIRQTLRLDYDTFINASFFLQGKADQFAQQKPADRKRILASILGLEVWEQYKEEALRRRREHELEMAACEGALVELNSELSEEEQRKATLKTLTDEYETRSALAQASKQILDQQRLISARLENDRTQLQKQSLEIKRLHEELDQKVDDLRDRQEEQKQFRLQIANETEIRKGHAEWLILKEQLSQMDAVAINFHQFESSRQEPLLIIEAEKASLQTELSSLEIREKEIGAIENKLEELQREVEEAKLAVAADEGQLEMRSSLENDLKEITAEKARAKAENLVLKTEMDELDARRKALREIHGASCPTCEKPLLDDEKEHIIADLTARGTQKAEIYRKNQKTLEQCDALYREKETALVSLQAVEADLKLQQRLFDSRSEELKRGRDEVEKWLSIGSKRLNEIRKKLGEEDFALAARKQISKIDQELKKIGYDAAAHSTLKTQEIAGRDFQEKFSLLEQSKSALTPLDREISALEKSIDAAEKHLTALEQDYKIALQKLSDDQASSPDLAELERNNRDLHEQANQLLSEVGSAKNKVEVLKNIRQQKAAKEEEKQSILQKIAQLKLLERAFGKDGIPALLIEHEIPNIAEQANKILGNLSFDEMKIDFRTQREYRDNKREDRKETLDIIISSGGIDREYELLSGGEAFRVNFAVRLALSRVLANRAGARLRTLVIDEGFGSQDAEGRQRLIEAINFARNEFSKIIVITHLEELKDAFSARIEVTKTTHGSQVQVVAG